VPAQQGHDPEFKHQYHKKKKPPKQTNKKTQNRTITKNQNKVIENLENRTHIFLMLLVFTVVLRQGLAM
jgi:hypothetical protein